MTAPRMNAKSARRTTRFLPRLSARIPETGDTRRANRAVAEVIKDLSRVVNGWPRELLIETNVAEITPVSSVWWGQYVSHIHSRINIHPNNSPQIPAENVKSQTKIPGCRKFLSRRRETSLKSTSLLASPSSPDECRISGSSALSAMSSSAIALEAVVKGDIWLFAPWNGFRGD
jgi:hypothetical protein